MEAIKKAGHEGKIELGMDVAASEFYMEKEKIYYKSTFPRESNISRACTSKILAIFYLI